MNEAEDARDLLQAIPEELAVVPINDGVVFPYMLVPLILTDENLVRLVDEALAGNKIIGVFTQRNRDVKKPGPEDIYRTGCAMLIQKMARFPDGHVRLVGQGLARISIARVTDDVPFMRARIDLVKEPSSSSGRTAPWCC